LESGELETATLSSFKEKMKSGTPPAENHDSPVSSVMLPGLLFLAPKNQLELNSGIKSE